MLANYSRLSIPPLINVHVLPTYFNLHLGPKCVHIFLWERMWFDIFKATHSGKSFKSFDKSFSQRSNLNAEAVFNFKECQYPVMDARAQEKRKSCSRCSREHF